MSLFGNTACRTAFTVLLTGVLVIAKKSKETPEWAKKDIRDFSDGDMAKLLDQWDEDEEPLEKDELPEHLRPQPYIDLSQIVDKENDPESLMKLTKKGRTLMMFVTVFGNPSHSESEQITKLWQTSLWNNHIQAERYMIDDDRAIFMFKDGSIAWQAKDFLVQQDQCKEVTIEGKTYLGKNNKLSEESLRKESIKKETKPDKKNVEL